MSKRISVAWAKQLCNEGQKLVEVLADNTLRAVTTETLKKRRNAKTITVYFA